MKVILQPLIEAKKFKMTRALRVLREAGWLKNWNEKGFAKKITGQVKGYCKRERRKRESRIDGSMRDDVMAESF